MVWSLPWCWLLPILVAIWAPAGRHPAQAAGGSCLSDDEGPPFTRLGLLAAGIVGDAASTVQKSCAAQGDPTPRQATEGLEELVTTTNK